uniref:Ribosomal protein n=1 Tax=Salarias fasciatus TaxID=181472 RepID=A0A672IFB1_SALFA
IYMIIALHLGGPDQPLESARCLPRSLHARHCTSHTTPVAARCLLLPPGPRRPHGASLLGQMKTKSALKRRCKDCFFVRRRGRLFVFCKTHPRHKQRQG